MHLRLRPTVLAMVAMALGGCFAAKDPDVKRYEPLASHANVLLGKVKAQIYRGNLAPDEIKAGILQCHPQAFEPFSGTRVFVDNREGTAFVMVCDAEADVKYVEEASCTVEVDYVYQEGSQKLPCAFSGKKFWCSE